MTKNDNNPYEHDLKARRTLDKVYRSQEYIYQHAENDPGITIRSLKKELNNIPEEYLDYRIIFSRVAFIVNGEPEDNMTPEFELGSPYVEDFEEQNQTARMMVYDRIVFGQNWGIGKYIEDD
jgi:hypothetical protein